VCVFTLLIHRLGISVFSFYSFIYYFDLRRPYAFGSSSGYFSKYVPLHALADTPVFCV
jgi:hypothetical protein